MKGSLLRQLIASGQRLAVAGAHDGMSARIAEEVGFKALWASGFCISASHALPDASILTMTQFLEEARQINDVVNVPVIADCDSGFGGIPNVVHMIRQYESAGIAAVCIEDKVFPKRNSLDDSPHVLYPIRAFANRIRAAKASQVTRDFCVIARVEALVANREMGEALERAYAYGEAGADLILVQSKAETDEEIREFCTGFRAFRPVVIVPTTYDASRLTDPDLGIAVVIFANQAFRASVTTMLAAYRELKVGGQIDDVASIRTVFRLQGMADLKAIEEKYEVAEDD